MNFEEALEVANEAVFVEVGRRLSKVEVAILKGSWDNLTYEEIASAANYSVAYVKRHAGPELWKLLAEALAEKVSKNNFRFALERKWHRHLNSTLTTVNPKEKFKLVINRTQKTAQYYVEDLGNEIKLNMVLIKSGSFLMGSPEDELERSDSESPQHLVNINQFCISKYPITQAQWKGVAALPQVNIELEADPSNFKGEERPVEQVSWYDAVEFCDRLSSHTKRQYRLPSEAEWEYVCRAGTTTPFHFGETITTDVANYDGTDDEEHKWSGSYGRGPKGIYRGETTVVGSFEVANAFGLYDMHGNVWEWCLDDWHDNYEGAPTDGSAWVDDNNNLSQKQGRAVLRGGSWINNPENCRSASRNNNNTRDNHNNNIGFRIVCAAGMSLHRESRQVGICP